MHATHNKYHQPRGSRKKQAQHLKNVRKLSAQREKDDAQNTEEDPNLQAHVSQGEKAGKSREKMSRFKIDCENVRPEEYVLIDSSALSAMVAGLQCPYCQNGELDVTLRSRRGAAFTIVLYCKICDTVHSQTPSSSRIIQDTLRPPYEINRKIVEAFIQIGSGYTAMLKFATVIGMKTMDQSTYRDHLNKLFEENENLKKKILSLAREAIRKAYIELDPSLDAEEVLDIDVSFDGSWHKRGFTSQYGIVSVIDILTGLVVDFEVLSKYCHMCLITAAELDEDSPDYNIWFEAHVKSGECRTNFDGLSGSVF